MTDRDALLIRCLLSAMQDPVLSDTEKQNPDRIVSVATQYAGRYMVTKNEFYRLLEKPLNEILFSN